MTRNTMLLDVSEAFYIHARWTGCGLTSSTEAPNNDANAAIQIREHAILPPMPSVTMD
jgi:hypothetical protein